MKDVLHITNGDGAGDLLRASGLGGTVLPWRDPMHHGPMPAGLDVDELSKVRAEYLAGDQLNRDAVLADFRARDAQLRHAGQHDEVWLWFEHDLLDQLQLLQIVDQLAANGTDFASVSVICIDRFEGIDSFRGIGQLSPEQLLTLVPGRQPIAPEIVALAQAGWAAFRADDPRLLQNFVEQLADTLWFVRPALERHLEEFPWTSDGLTRSERQILEIIGDGTDAPGAIFSNVMALERYLFAGDLPTFRWMERLNAAREPLIICTSGKPFLMPRRFERPDEAFRSQRLVLTDAGRAVLAGTRRARGLIERNIWLGGVLVESERGEWMWDHQAGRIVLMPGASNDE